MHFTPLPFSATLDEYRDKADQLFEAYRAGDSGAICLFHENHPRFLDPDIRWLPRNVSDDEIRNAGMDMSDAQLVTARAHDFESWPHLERYVNEVTAHGPVWRFECAIEAVISGDVETLQHLLRENPDLVRARSTRVTKLAASAHEATLVHYVAANGVEGFRQKCPPNAVEVATMLLRSGADVDAFANMYGGECTPMALLVSSEHPAKTGVQVALVDTFLDFGAAIEGRGSCAWSSPLMTALAFGYREAAEALVRRGAKIDRLAAAAGLGRIEKAARLLEQASPAERHRALALAAQHGHANIVHLLLDAGEDPNRYNPEHNHGHSTPLHQAALNGYEDVVRLLVERGASLDVRDRIYDCTPLDWAVYGGRGQIEQYLRERGAKSAKHLV